MEVWSDCAACSLSGSVVAPAVQETDRLKGAGPLWLTLQMLPSLHFGKEPTAVCLHVGGSPVYVYCAALGYSELTSYCHDVVRRDLNLMWVLSIITFYINAMMKDWRDEDQAGADANVPVMPVTMRPG